MTGELSPGKSIRHYCLWCCLGSPREVNLCPSETCALWPWRFGRRPETVGLERRLDGRTATQAIYSRCRDCYEFRKDCRIPDADCDLHHIRAKGVLPRETASTVPVQREVALTGAPTRVQPQVVP